MQQFGNLFMTIVFDENFKVKEVVNQIPDVFSSDYMEIFGLSIDDLLDNSPISNLVNLRLFKKALIESRVYDKGTYIEYQTEQDKKDNLVTTCYCKTISNGDTITNVIKIEARAMTMGRDLRIIRNSFDSIDVAVYVRAISADSYFLWNNKAKELYEMNNILSSKHWDQSQEDAEDNEVISNKETRVYYRKWKNSKDEPISVRVTKRYHTNIAQEVFIFTTCEILDDSSEDATKKLKKLQIQTNELLKRLPVALEMFDLDGNIIDSNAKDNVLLHKFNIYHTSDYNFFNDSNFSPKILQSIKNGEQIQFDLLLSKDGINSHLLYNVSSIKNKKGEVLYYIFTISDESEKTKQLIDKNRIAEEQKNSAVEADKLKSAFIANMSHEIRTPINSIVGFADLLRNASSEEEKDEFCKIIKSSSNILLDLINDVLDLSKIEAGFIEFHNVPFDISELIKQLVASISNRAKPNVTMSYVLPANHCIVNLDKSRISQIITNFAVNATKFTSEGYIKVGYNVIKKGIKIFVEDTGMGVSKEKQESIFKRFEKINFDIQGTGLGLSICKSIVNYLNGSIGVDSELGKGSTFWAIIPCEPQLNKEEKAEDFFKQESMISSPLDKKTILIAEDNDNNYLLISLILKKFYNLIRALNGEEAIQLVKDKRPDIVFMDIQMPIMDGLSATREIRKFDTQMPIIALTAHAFDSDKEKALAAGCNDFLTKPVDITMINEVVRKYVL